MRSGMTMLFAGVLLLAGMAPSPASAKETTTVTASAQTISYGGDALQTLDFWPASSSGSAPLVVLVHGGGLQRGDKSEAAGRWKAEHFPKLGYAFATVNYRLAPTATAEEACQDIADALKTLVAKAAELGIDPRRIVVIGHGGGGNLVGLIGTDERYLAKAGLSYANLAGIVGIDSALYDIPTRMRDEGPPAMHEAYRQAFGTDPVRQRALSPAIQAANSPNVRNVLLMHINGLPSAYQANSFARALADHDGKVEVHGFPGGPGLSGHDEIIQRLGDPSYAPTATLDAWLKTVLAR